MQPGYLHISACSIIKSNAPAVPPMFTALPKVYIPQAASLCLTWVCSTWVICHASETLSTHLPTEHRTLLKVASRRACFYPHCIPSLLSTVKHDIIHQKYWWDLGSHPSKQLDRLSGLLPSFLLDDPIWTWEPIGLRESAVRLKSLKESGWAQAFNGELGPIISIFICLDFFGLTVDVVIQSLGQYHAGAAVKVLGTDG